DRLRLRGQPHPHRRSGRHGGDRRRRALPQHLLQLGSSDLRVQCRHRDGAGRSRTLRPLRAHGSGVTGCPGGGACGGRRRPGHRGRERLCHRPTCAFRDRPGSSLDGGLHQPGPVSGSNDHPLPMPRLIRRRAHRRGGSGWIDTMRASRRDPSRRQEAGVRTNNCDLPRLAVVPGTLVLLIALVTACGSTPSGSSASAHLRTPTAQASATPIVTADPGDPTLLPVPADVAFLQAPIAIQNEWRTYYATGSITVVPNSTVPFTRPATPRVVDATNGVVSSTKAQLWGDAVMRETAWENWAITADQTGLFDDGVISSSEAEPGLVLPQGATAFR